MTVKAKKHLGQHFLNDEIIAQQIVNGLTWNDFDHVLEIGPGMGVLTKHLLNNKKNVSVIEIDNESVAYLQQQYPLLTIYNQDFLQVDLSTIVGNKPLAIIGNFPYNISTQIVFKILENRILIPEMVGMFQKEVAERIAAPHGNKTYGILSVLTQAFYHVEYLFTVNENVFTPPPKVKSGVIRIKRHTQKLDVNERLFFVLVKTAFNQRRKTLKNALKSLNLPLENLTNDLLKLRAEQLSVQQFLAITKNLSPND